MIIIGLMVYRGNDKEKYNNKKYNNKIPYNIKIYRIIPIGFLVGFASGFFGIGGGFLIVPGLLFSADLSMIEAVGTSLISVGTFGIISALTYALSSEIDPLISILYIIRGMMGGHIGERIASNLPRNTLRKIFSIIIIVAIYIIYENIHSILRFI